MTMKTAFDSKGNFVSYDCHVTIAQPLSIDKIRSNSIFHHMTFVSMLEFLPAVIFLINLPRPLHFTTHYQFPQNPLSHVLVYPEPMAV